MNNPPVTFPTTCEQLQDFIGTFVKPEAEALGIPLQHKHYIAVIPCGSEADGVRQLLVEMLTHIQERAVTRIYWRVFPHMETKRLFQTDREELKLVARYSLA